MSRLIAGALSIAFGLVLLFGYDANDYRLENAYQAATIEESVRIQRENATRDEARDFHQIAMAVSLGFGMLLVLSGIWQLRHPDDPDASEPLTSDESW